MMMKRTIYPICLLAALMVLAGCQLGKHYTRPELDLPTTLGSQTADDSASIADHSWEELYTDTLLQGLIRKTLEYNKDMQMSAARVKELAALKRIDVANMFPQVGAKVYLEPERENYGGDNYKKSDEFGIKASATWELDLWGNLRWARDKSLADFMGSIENRRALQMSLIAQVAQAYFELVALDNELAIVRQTVEARRESLHLVRLRREAGLISEIPLRQAQVELAKTVTLVPDLDRASQAADVQLPDALPVGMPSTLLERRPDVRQAEQALIAANAQVGMAFTALFPRIALTATAGSESGELGDILKSPYHLFSANLLQPIFAMGKNRAMLKAKKAQRLQGCLQRHYGVQQDKGHLRHPPPAGTGGQDDARTGPAAVRQRCHRLHRPARRPAYLLRRPAQPELCRTRQAHHDGQPLQGPRRRVVVSIQSLHGCRHAAVEARFFFYIFSCCLPPVPLARAGPPPRPDDGGGPRRPL